MITDPEDMAAAAFAHYDGLLGTDLPRECTMNLQHLVEPTNLDDLEAPFNEEEIWQTVKRPPARRRTAQMDSPRNSCAQAGAWSSLISPACPSNYTSFTGAVSVA